MSIVKLNNQAVKNATSFGSISSLGSMVLIKKLTASSSATLSFVDGSDGVVLDDTYKEYVFTFNNMHPSIDNSAFQFNLSTDGGSNYNVAKTTTYFFALHKEDGTLNNFTYSAGADLAQGTGNQQIAQNIGADNDQSMSGSFTLFNPSSTTFVKHFISSINDYNNNDFSLYFPIAGYFNTTSAIDEIQFKVDTGNIETGEIIMYGIKDS